MLGEGQLGLEEGRQAVPVFLLGGRRGPSNGHCDRAGLGERDNPLERGWHNRHSVECLEDLETQVRSLTTTKSAYHWQLKVSRRGQWHNPSDLSRNLKSLKKVINSHKRGRSSLPVTALEQQTLPA